MTSVEVSQGAQPAADPKPLPIRTQKGSVFSLALANYAAMGINMLTGPIMARVLGPTGRGALAAISVWDEASSRIFYLGLPDAVAYRTKEGLDAPGALLGAIRRLGFLLFPIALAAGLLVAHWPLGSLDPRSKILIVVLVAMSPLINTFGRSCFQMLTVNRDMKSLRIATIILNTVGLVVIVVAALFGALAVWVAALAIVLGRLCQHAFSWWRAKVKISGRARLGPMLAYGIKAMPGSLSDLANNRLDQLFVVPYLGFKQLGFYAVAVTVNFIPFQLGTAISSSVYGRVRLETDRGPGGVSSRVIRRGFVAAGAAAVLVAIATPTALPLVYGKRFDPSVIPTLVLLPGTVAWAVTMITTQVGNAIGRPQYASSAQIVGLAITLGGLPLMIPRYGITGAAIVSSVTYVVRLMITLVLLRRQGVTGTTPLVQDLGWLWKRSRHVATRPLRMARAGRRVEVSADKVLVDPRDEALAAATMPPAQVDSSTEQGPTAVPDGQPGSAGGGIPDTEPSVGASDPPADDAQDRPGGPSPGEDASGA